MNQSGNGEPRIFERNDPALVGLHNLADRWFSFDPPDWPADLKSMGKEMKMTRSQKDEATKNARNRSSGAQHDAEEFKLLIMNGVETSFDQW